MIWCDSLVLDGFLKQLLFVTVPTKISLLQAPISNFSLNLTYLWSSRWHSVQMKSIFIKFIIIYSQKKYERKVVSHAPNTYLLSEWLLLYRKAQKVFYIKITNAWKRLYTRLRSNIIQRFNVFLAVLE